MNTPKMLFTAEGRLDVCEKLKPINLRARPDGFLDQDRAAPMTDRQAMDLLMLSPTARIRHISSVNSGFSPRADQDPILVFPAEHDTRRWTENGFRIKSQDPGETQLTRLDLSKDVVFERFRSGHRNREYIQNVTDELTSRSRMLLGARFGHALLSSPGSLEYLRTRGIRTICLLGTIFADEKDKFSCVCLYHFLRGMNQGWRWNMNRRIWVAYLPSGLYFPIIPKK